MGGSSYYSFWVVELEAYLEAFLGLVEGVTQSLDLERSSWRLKQGEGNSTQTYSLPLPLCEGWNSYILCSDFILVSCLFYLVVVWMFVCLWVCWEDLKTMLFWMISFHVYVWKFEIFLAWVFWYHSPLERAEVTNFGKALFSWTPKSVESLLRMRRGRKGRVLWAPTYQHKPCMIMVCWNERTEVLVI